MRKLFNRPKIKKIPVLDIVVFSLLCASAGPLLKAGAKKASDQKKI